MSGTQTGAGDLRHASCVSFGPDDGILIEGPSGSGKSSLSLALIAQGAQLVADDRTLVFAAGGLPHARSPRPIAGLIELRGLGLIRMSARRLTRLRLVLTLVTAGTEDPPTARLPAPRLCERAGCRLPCLEVAGAENRPVHGDFTTLAQGLAQVMRSAIPGGGAVHGLWPEG